MNRDSASRYSQGDFDAAFEAAAPQLEQAVFAACPRDADWPSRVTSAIYAVLDFAIANRDAIRVLTREALLNRPYGPGRYLELVERFAEMLRAEAPDDPQLPAFTEQALIGAVAITITDHLRDGTLDRLREAGPDLVELSLRPYLGRTAARRWSQALP
jgi:hypothetical protein